MANPRGKGAKGGKNASAEAAAAAAPSKPLTRSKSARQVFVSRLFWIHLSRIFIIIIIYLQVLCNSHS